MKKLIIENPEQFQNHFSRSAVFTREKIEGKEGYRNVIATENPALVMDWYRWEVIREVLLMTGCQIPANRQLVLLDNHSRFDTSCIKGSTREVEVIGTELVGMTLISKTAEREGILVDEGHLTDTSIGYQVLERTIIKPGESAVINGRTFENNYGDNLDLQIVTKWRPFENSLTPIGADQAAKFRSQFAPKTETAAPAETQREKLEFDSKLNLEEIITKINERSSNLEISIIKENPMGDTMLTPEERTAKIDAIFKIVNDEGTKRNLPGIDVMSEAREFMVNDEKSVEDFQSHLFTLLKRAEPSRTANGQIDLTKKEVENYSIREIVLAQLTNDYSKIQPQLEMSRALAKSQGIEESTKGILIPDQVQRRRRSINMKHMSENQRTIIAGAAGTGQYTIQDQYIAESFIDLLTNASVFLPNVSFITGLKGNIPMVRETIGSTFAWAAEGSGPALSTPAFSQENMTPKKGGARIQLSYEWLRQTSLDAEMYVERRLAEDCALGLDSAIAYGTGTTQPTGLKLVSGIGGVEGISFSRAKALEMIKDILDSGAGKLGAPKWISNATVWATLKNLKIDNGSGLFLVDDNNTMLGYDFKDISGQVQNSDLFLGIWNKLIVGYWDQLEILANPYADAVFAAGDVQIRALLAADVFCLRPTAFALAEGVS